MTTGYTDIDDVTTYDAYIDAVKWAKDEGILDSTSTKFLPSDYCTRADFVTWLWKYAGKPTVETKANFEDVESGAYYEDAVNWATNQGIVNGTTATTFSPEQTCNRAEIVTFLYRFSNISKNNSIRYNLMGGTVEKENPTSYKSGLDTFTLNNPIKTGYTFAGWTGSNYSKYVENNYVSQTTVTITTSDVGNKAYTANWTANNYIVSFNPNGGVGTMENQYYIYDAVPQRLLENTFIRRGYVFLGWNTKADGTGSFYSDLETVSNLTETNNATIILYAQWDHDNQHIYEKLVTSPTCTEQGYTTNQCIICEYSYVDGYTDALGHTEIIDKVVEATCTQAGLTQGKHCSVCDTVIIKQEEIPAKGHDYEAKVTNPTCTEKGYTTNQCIICEYSYVDAYTDALGHTEIIDKVVEATCTQAGLTQGKHCSACDTVIIKQEEIPAKGHDYEAKVTNPTCTEKGYTTNTCTRCQDNYVYAYTEALGHSFINYTSNNDATCTQDGTKTAKCDRCDETDTKADEGSIVPHNYEDGKCTMCGEKEPKLEITSETYKIENTYISKVQEKTTIKTFKENLQTNATEIKVYSKDGEEQEETAVMTTGMQVQLKYRNDTKTFTISVAGDVDGDGSIKLSDMSIVNRYRLNKRTLEGEYFLAADVNGDGVVDFKDLVKVNRYRLSKITEM